ncbi:MAG: thiamine pyrophosphate-dependent dehydrogenase E1 component subunit alpha [Chloroflexi bacterium]|nr:thiamine pyrophosphate-dependent dehydrogenase E1 component subunit alpha [Chloroflexota bacterium]
MRNDELETPYQIMDPAGKLLGNIPEGLSNQKLLEWYRLMWEIRGFSNKTVALQRQGRSTTWGPLNGQEATAIGMGAVLQPQDWLVGSYRDTGAYITKGYPMAALFYYTRGFSIAPELIGPDRNCLPYQIVLATQTLHGVGIAMASRIKKENAVTMIGVGDGASSEGDFNEALNFAGVFKAPAVIVLVNNGWAISTPRSHQSAARYLMDRAVGFGMPGILVDGNDVLACYSVMKEAVERARHGEGPTLIEAITYRHGAHTTADDPTRYRDAKEVEYWMHRDPTLRLKNYLIEQGVWSEEKDKQLLEDVEKYVNEQADIAYNHPTPGPDGMFNNVFEKLTPRMLKQREELRRELNLEAEVK